MDLFIFFFLKQASGCSQGDGLFLLATRGKFFLLFFFKACSFLNSLHLRQTQSQNVTMSVSQCLHTLVPSGPIVALYLRFGVVSLQQDSVVTNLGSQRRACNLGGEGGSQLVFRGTSGSHTRKWQLIISHKERPPFRLFYLKWHDTRKQNRHKQCEAITLSITRDGCGMWGALIQMKAVCRWWSHIWPICFDGLSKVEKRHRMESEQDRKLFAHR